MSPVPKRCFSAVKAFCLKVAEQLHFGIPSQNQHFPQEMVDLCLCWSRWEDRQQVACGGVPVSVCPWQKVPLSLLSRSVDVFLQSTQKEKGEENPYMDMIFLGSCRTTWYGNRPFRRHLGKANQVEVIPDISHPGKVGTVCYSVMLVFYYWAFMSMFP